MFSLGLGSGCLALRAFDDLRLDRRLVFLLLLLVSVIFGSIVLNLLHVVVLFFFAVLFSLLGLLGNGFSSIGLSFALLRRWS
jgi:hypothetical protein